MHVLRPLDFDAFQTLFLKLSWLYFLPTSQNTTLVGWKMLQSLLVKILHALNYANNREFKVLGSSL